MILDNIRIRKIERDKSDKTQCVLSLGGLYPHRIDELEEFLNREVHLVVMDMEPIKKEMG